MTGPATGEALAAAANTAGGAALAYAALGWPVLPVAGMVAGRCGCRRRQACTHPAKHPLVPDGTKRATTDPTTIRGWYAHWDWAGVGVVTGPRSGLAVLDVDPAHGGTDSLAELEALGLVLPDTITAETGGGGAHYLFASGGGVANTSGRLPGLGPTPGLDLRGTGGYIVAPPSGHRSGGRYRWRPTPAALADLPEWLQRRPAPPPSSPPQELDHPERYVRAVLQREVARVVAAPEGVRNDSLNRAAFALGTLVGGGAVARVDVEAALRDAATSAGIPALEAERTIRSGLDAGADRPRAIPRRSR